MIGRDEVFYRDDLARVSRLWLTDESTSYAIRTLIKLSFIERRSPPIRSVLLFFFTLALLFFSCLYLVREIVPAAIAWVLIALSVALVLGAGWFAFVKKPVFLIKAAFQDGSVVKIMRRSREQAHDLHTAINKAMSLNRFNVSAYDDDPAAAVPANSAAASVNQAQAVRKRQRIRRLLALLSSSSD